MTTSELMKAMADAGAPFEAILIAIQALDAKDAEIVQRDKEQAERRARDAERKRHERAAGQFKRRPRTVRGRSKDCPMDPPIEEDHTPVPDISSDDESQSQSASDECEAVREAWNAMASANDLTVCSKITGKRLKLCRARLKDNGLSEIQRAIERIPKSRFLLGQTGSWSAGIDWLLKPDSVTQILEGKYDDRQATQRQPSGNQADPRTPFQRVCDERIFGGSVGPAG